MLVTTVLIRTAVTCCPTQAAFWRPLWLFLPTAADMRGFGTPFRPAFFTEIYNN